jgi:hypothetical protein
MAALEFNRGGIRPHARQVLPRIWATASSQAHPVQERKRPHCLRLAATQAKPRQPAPPREAVLATPRQRRSVVPGLVFYRVYTEALLRRYATMSMENGRVPSLLGRELFSGQVTGYKVKAFDDSVIFVHDVDNCLKLLDPGSRHLVRRIAVEGYTREETAALIGVSLRTVFRRYGEAIDKLTRLMLDRNILAPGVGERSIDA